MSGGSEKTVTQGTNEPWPDAQPALREALGRAQGIANYDGPDYAFAPYTESNVVPFDAKTTQGMGLVEGQANDATAQGYLKNPTNFLTGLYGTGGLSADQNLVGDLWRNTATGGEMGANNPYFEDMLSKSLNDARTGTDLSISGSGRYGSGAHTGVLADRLGGISTQARYGEYQNQQGRQDAARGNLASLGQQGVTNLFGAGQALPQAYTTAQMPANDLFKLGAMNEDLVARQKADAERIFREKQQSILGPTEWLNAIATGAGSLGGSSSQTNISPGTNPFLQALGIGVGANSLLGNPLGGIFG